MESYTTLTQQNGQDDSSRGSIYGNSATNLGGTRISKHSHIHFQEEVKYYAGNMSRMIELP